jgi:3-deoxy-manno-octulosonate cytidylyltransferase (CMP-KDO synthetase)
MRTAVIIPARLESTRLPGKVLLDLAGKPMIQWVHERVRGARAVDELHVATDSADIERVCRGFGASVLRTSAAHRCGTDRCAEAAAHLDADVVINVQADEPLLDPPLLDRLAAAFADPDVRMASAMSRITSAEDRDDPHVVKVVCDRRGRALYFSRAPIPWPRRAEDGLAGFRHLGVYAYRRRALLDFVALPPARLEEVEGLEQLRALDHGWRIDMIEAPRAWPSVDTAADLARVRAILERHEPS